MKLFSVSGLLLAILSLLVTHDVVLVKAEEEITDEMGGTTDEMGGEPDTNKLLCNYIDKLKRMAWIHAQDDPPVPSELGQGRIKVLNAIVKAEEGNLLGSMNLLQNSVKFSEMFPGSLAEALSILASGYSRSVTKGLIKLVKDDLDPAVLAKAEKKVEVAILLRDEEDEYRNSVIFFVKAVRAILKSDLFEDRFLDPPVCN